MVNDVFYRQNINSDHDYATGDKFQFYKCFWFHFHYLIIFNIRLYLAIIQWVSAGYNRSILKV